MVIVLTILKWIIRIWCGAWGIYAIFYMVGGYTGNVDVRSCECGGMRIKTKGIWRYFIQR